METRRIPYLVGNTFKSDHTYWPLTDYDSLVSFMAGLGSDGDNVDDVWNNTISIKALMAFAWRVQTWEIQVGGTVHFEASAHGTFPYNGTHTIVYDGSVIEALDVQLVGRKNPYNISEGNKVIALGEELLLISLPPPTHEIAISGLRNFGIDTSGVLNNSKIDVTWSFDGGYMGGDNTDSNLLFTLFQRPASHRWARDVLIDDGGGELKPASGFSIWAASIIANFSFGIRGNQIHTSGGTAAIIGGKTGTLTIDPVIADPFDIDLWMQGTFIPTGGDGSDATGSGTASFTIKAKKFFTYKNRNGDPVFDEDTGDQINDPFA